MQRHWKEVQELFGTLAYMVKDSDPDGIELHFTISGQNHQSKHTKGLVKVLGKKSYEGHSNIRSSLNTIVRRYLEKVEAPAQVGRARWSWAGHTNEPVPAQNVYVFTDGIWQPEYDPTEIIENLVKNLRDRKIMKEQFGIQFISFGNDPDGLAVLNRLDSGLNLPS